MLGRQGLVHKYGLGDICTMSVGRLPRWLVQDFFLFRNEECSRSLPLERHAWISVQHLIGCRLEGQLMLRGLRQHLASEASLTI